jgi:hypothetical protein
MVARTRIRCLVVAVPAEDEREVSRGALSREVLPWADPYVAGLIKKLQDEVRRERKFRSIVRNYHHAAADTANDGMLYVQ